MKHQTQVSARRDYKIGLDENHRHFDLRKEPGRMKVLPELLELFAKYYLHESRPSLAVTWRHTLHFALHDKPGTTPETFPSVSAFYRALQNQYDKSIIYMLRYGQRAWNRHWLLKQG